MTKSEADQRLHGEHHSRIKHNPKADGLPVMPDSLGKYAKQHWKDTIPQLIEMGLATAADQSTLEGLCDWWHFYQVSKATLEKCPEPGIDRQRAFNEYRQSWQEYSRLARQFGLTPQSRATINVDPQVNNPADEFLDA